MCMQNANLDTESISGGNPAAMYCEGEERNVQELWLEGGVRCEQRGAGK